MTIQIDEIIYSKRRTIELRITTDGRLLVRAPRSASRDFIERSILKKQSWILKKIHKVEMLYGEVKPKKYITGESFSFLGKKYNLRLIDNFGKKLVFNEEFLLPCNLATQAKSLLEHWYRSEAKQLILERVKFYAEQYGFIYRKVTLTSAQKRWGSCNSRANLNFSWRLIMAPQEVIDYVIVHELAHLTHLNHSKHFWDKVASIMPNYKIHQKWLKLNGPLLTI